MTTTTVAAAQPGRISGAARWAGIIIGGLVVLFLIFDAVIKLLQLPQAIDSTVALGYPAGAVLTIGLIELACLALYLVPRTAPLGAVLLTGHLGGVVATHIRAGSPAFSIVFALVFGALVWLSLWLRDARLRAIVAARA